MDGRSLICADVGNSRTKVAVAGDGETGWQHLQSVASPESLDLSSVDVADWCVVSVNQPRLDSLRDWVDRNRRSDRLTVLNRSDIPLKLNIEHPERLGLDRLAAAYGALQLAGSSAEPIIIVYVGTAVTIDLLDGAGIFQGGAIFPGPYTCFQSLSRATNQLPELFVGEVPAVAWGKNTAEAIACGVWQMQVGAIREIVSRYQREMMGEPANRRGVVFLTGGGAAPLEPIFQREFRLVSDLVLQGVRAAASRRRVS
ncbi:MAG: type III pantothenate kinase [Planctomycetota bacterium]